MDNQLYNGVDRLTIRVILQEFFKMHKTCQPTVSREFGRQCPRLALVHAFTQITLAMIWWGGWALCATLAASLFLYFLAPMCRFSPISGCNIKVPLKSTKDAKIFLKILPRSHSHPEWGWGDRQPRVTLCRGDNRMKKKYMAEFRKNTGQMTSEGMSCRDDRSLLCRGQKDRD